MDYRFKNADYVIIAGAAKQFYLSKTCNVLLFWHVETECSAVTEVGDTAAQNESLSLKLFVDGQTVSNERRQLKTTGLDYGITAINAAESNPERRKWSGHCIVQLTAGWHNAGIGIAHQTYHVRTATKRFGYVALRA